MTSLTDSPVKESPVKGSITIPDMITVHVWEVFLSKNKNNLQSLLETYAVDSTSGIHEDGGTVVYRFTSYDWNKTLCELLERNNIPVFVQESFVNSEN